MFNLLIYFYTYLFFSFHDLFEKIDIGGMHWRQVGLAVLQEKVVQLLLGLHLGAELIYAESGEVILLHGILLELKIEFGGSLPIILVFNLIK